MTSNSKEAQHLKELAQAKGLFLFEAITTRYFKTYQKIREWLPKIGQIKLVESQYSQYSRRYDAFQKGEILPVFDPVKAGGAMMDLNLYNLHFVMGLFGKPQAQHYFANVERGIDTSGVAVLTYPDFVAICTAAKDSKGRSGGLIQGTKGYIETSLSPNLIGEVKLVLNDGSKESFDDGLSQARLIPEFQAFVKMIDDKDLEACYKELEASLSVSKVQTELRKEAGLSSQWIIDMANETILETAKGNYNLEHLKELERIENQLRFKIFGSLEALALGEKILKSTEAEEVEKLAIQIIRVSDNIPIFQYLGNEAKERNLGYIRAKVAAVLASNHNSLWSLVAHHVGKIELSSKDLETQLPVSGAFPIKVGEELVAVVGLSGLKNGNDFRALISGMSDYLSVQPEAFTGFLI